MAALVKRAVWRLPGVAASTRLPTMRRWAPTRRTRRTSAYAAPAGDTNEAETPRRRAAALDSRAGTDRPPARGAIAGATAGGEAVVPSTLTLASTIRSEGGADAVIVNVAEEAGDTLPAASTAIAFTVVVRSSTICAP